jgi:hypothetical protein
MHRTRVSQLAVLLAVVTLSLTCFAQSQNDGPITNADLERMVKAGLSETTILRVMQVSPTNFATSANALIDLKHHHVSDAIINALLDNRGGAVASPFESQASSPVDIFGPHMPGTHQLPNLDAALRLNSNTTAKVSVRQNRIKVERSGVPLFSLTWKEQGAR